MLLGVRRLILPTALALTALHAGPPVEALSSSRESTVAGLEALIANGPVGHTSHDAGELLQLAVDDAIARGDTAIERLAVRAAAPLKVRVTRPVSASANESAPTIEISARTFLKVPRPVSHTSEILASLDGADFVSIGTVQSDSGKSFRLDAAFGPAALVPGLHVVRARARLKFLEKAAGRESWTETRDLPELSYVIYNSEETLRPEAAGWRAFVHGPAAIAANQFDASLGDQPLAAWLAGVFSERRNNRDPEAPHWMSQYCSERTSEPDATPDATAICSVAYLQARGDIVELWFRTASVRATETGTL
jgi:hypothetical protein